MIAFLLAVAMAIPADRSAQDILSDARRAYRVENAIQTVRMTLVSKSGTERVRELEMRVRQDGEQLKSYTRFQSPSDVAGTQLVLIDTPNQDDEQLLYLPAMHRVTRIAGSARSGSFVGSDFRYSDFELDDGPGATYTLVEETSDHWTIDTTFGGSSDWSRIETRISSADQIPRQVTWWDKDGVKARELTVDRVDVKDGVSVAMVSVMKDLKRGSSTRMEVTSIQVKVPASSIPDDTFTSAYLERSE